MLVGVWICVHSCLRMTLGVSGNSSEVRSDLNVQQFRDLHPTPQLFSSLCTPCMSRVVTWPPSWSFDANFRHCITVSA